MEMEQGRHNTTTSPRRRGRRAVLALAAGVGAAGLAATASGSSARADDGAAIVGSWMLAVSGPARMTLQTYTAGGGLVTTQADHLRRGPGHGAWIQTGDRGFLATHVSMRFDEGGELIGTTRLRLDITVGDDGASFTSRNIREEFDLAGALEQHIDASGAGTRIVPLSLD